MTNRPMTMENKKRLNLCRESVTKVMEPAGHHKMPNLPKHQALTCRGCVICWFIISRKVGCRGCVSRMTCMHTLLSDVAKMCCHGVFFMHWLGPGKSKRPSKGSLARIDSESWLQALGYRSPSSETCSHTYWHKYAFNRHVSRHVCNRA